MEQRLPAAQAFAREHKLNEFFDGDLKDIGIIVLGGLYNTVSRALARLGLADAFGNARVPIYCLNLAYPLIPEEVKQFCIGKKHVLIVEEGSPEFVEQAIATELRRADIQTRIHGKGALPKAGEYSGEVMLRGLANFLSAAKPAGIDTTQISATADKLLGHKPAAAQSLADLPPRPPNFCTGCPERPVFAALKLTQREIGRTHISTDIGCHSFATFAPFSMGNSILGYGMSLAAAAAVTPNVKSRPISVMGDGGFWHNGLITGVASNLFNKNDGLLIVMQNGYTSGDRAAIHAVERDQPPGHGAGHGHRADAALVRRQMAAQGAHLSRLRDGEDSERGDAHAGRGLKVIIADGECQLARQRRVRAEDAVKLKAGKRVVRTKFGVDDEICTGDHSCIRLSGCPSLTVKPSPDPLRTDPVASVIESCVGCGLCGEVAHAAVLCPSFYRAELIQNASAWDRFLHRMRRTVIGWLAPREVAA